MPGAQIYFPATGCTLDLGPDTPLPHVIHMEKIVHSSYQKSVDQLSVGPDLNRPDGLWIHRAKLFWPGTMPQNLPVAVKWVHGSKRLHQLRKEAEWYSAIHARLQPICAEENRPVVPYYGIFEGEMQGVVIGCLVLGWSERLVYRTEHDKKEFAEPAYGAARMLHAIGICHFDLGASDFRKFRLYFPPSMDRRVSGLGKDRRMCIIGFKDAEFHQCAGDSICPELQELRENLRSAGRTNVN